MVPNCTWLYISLDVNQPKWPQCYFIVGIDDIEIILLRVSNQNAKDIPQLLRAFFVNLLKLFKMSLPSPIW